jgi:hypothetical protein
VRFVARYQGAEHSGEPTADGIARIKFEEVSVRDVSPSVPGWYPIVGAVFAAFTVLSLFFLIIQPQAIPEGNRIPFDIWVAFCLAASASFLGGSASAHGRLPLPFVSDAPIQFSALGGVAIFIVSLLVLVNVYR